MGWWRSVICCTCQFPWCKYFQATTMLSLNVEHVKICTQLTCWKDIKIAELSYLLKIIYILFSKTYIQKYCIESLQILNSMVHCKWLVLLKLFISNFVRIHLIHYVYFMHVWHVDYWTFVGKLIWYSIVKDSYTLKIQQNVSKLDKTFMNHKKVARKYISQTNNEPNVSANLLIFL